MREALGHVQHPVIGGAQYFAHVLPVSGRIAPEVDDDVVQCAGGAAHQLGLLEWGRLVVHAAQRSLQPVEGDAALYERVIELVRLELAAAPGTGEKAALVFVLFQFEHEGPFQPGLREDH